MLQLEDKILSSVKDLVIFEQDLRSEDSAKLLAAVQVFRRALSLGEQ